MALTRNFCLLVKSRAANDPKFREGLLREALRLFLRGEMGTANRLFKDWIGSGKEPRS